MACKDAAEIINSFIINTRRLKYSILGYTKYYIGSRAIWIVNEAFPKVTMIHQSKCTTCKKS